ncbi:unnamed protein product [Closterium sp. Yama58-4]|nr:unnamed protein product [Closterium sp. Yama58-4]
MSIPPRSSRPHAHIQFLSRALLLLPFAAVSHLSALRSIPPHPSHSLSSIPRPRGCYSHLSSPAPYIAYAAMTARSRLGALYRPLLASATPRLLPTSATAPPALSGAVVGTVTESTCNGRAHSGDGGAISFQPAAARPHQSYESHHHRHHHPQHSHQQQQQHYQQQQQRRGLAAVPSRINLAAAPSAVAGVAAPSAVARAAEPSNFNMLEGAAESIGWRRGFASTPSGIARAAAAEPSNFNVLEGAAESSGRVFITAYDDKGFTVGGRDLDSSILCVGDVALCWSPSCLADVTSDSLALFQLIRPQPELLLLGTGQRMQAVPGELRKFVRACGMKLEVLSTRHAIATLNVLNEEGRSVAAALLLPSA